MSGRPRTAPEIGADRFEIRQGERRILSRQVGLPLVLCANCSGDGKVGRPNADLPPPLRDQSDRTDDQRAFDLSSRPCAFWRPRREIKRALIVCPIGLIAQWRRQIRIWAPDLPVSTAVGARDQRKAAWRANATLTLSNFESVRADLWAQSEAARCSWDVVVVDEAQRIKNAKSGVAAVLKSLERSRSWALTGTPLENRLDDLISVLDFAAPGEFDPGAMGVGLRGLMSRVQLRRRRAEVLDDLPPKFASVIGLDLTATQRAAYRKAEEKGTVWLRSLGRELRISHVLELILRLKQICNFCPETGDSAKLDDLRDRLEEFSASDAKALVFSQFVAEPFGVRRLARELQKFRPLVIIGAMDQAARSAALGSLERDQSRRVMIFRSAREGRD